MKNGYRLRNTFSNCKISDHRTIEAAIKANQKTQRTTKKRNGLSSYLPTEIVQVVNGEEQPLAEDEQLYALEYDYNAR